MGRITSRLVLALLSAFMVCNAAPLRTTAPSERPGDRVIQGTIVVKLKPGVASGAAGTLSSALTNSLRQRGVTSLSQAFPGVLVLARANPMAQQGLDRIFFASIPSSADPRVIAERISRLPQVEYAEPKYLQTLYDTPNDPSFGANQSGYLALINVATAWTTVKTNGSVIVADVDGGTYWQHEDIRPNIYGDTATQNVGWNFVTNTGNPDGSSATPMSAFHGTATASIMAAATNNGIGIAGTAWNCILMPINSASATTDNAIAFGYEGIQFAVAHGAKVINCSWGRTGSFSQFEHDVVASAAASGVLIVAAAANGSVDNDFIPNYPSSFKEVLGVGATNSTNTTIASFTNYGISVPVYAPGVDIWGALNGGGYGDVGSGTSFSTPLTAGLAALLFTQHPTWTPAQVAAQIRVTADPLDAANPSFAGNLGHGMVDFGRAVTESHPGLEIVSDTSIVSSGQNFIVPGDTVRISVTLRNILPPSANNVQFTLTSSDASLSVLTGAASVTSMPQGAEITLPDFVLRAESVTGSKTIVLALRWVSNGTDADAFALPVLVFSAPPVWRLHDTPAPSGLFSIKAVSTSVIWAAGGDGSKTAPSVVRSVDGGATWKDVTGGLSGVDLYCIDATDSLHAWAGTSDGRILASTDGGNTWNVQPYAGTQSPFIDGVWFFDNLNGRALGDPPGGTNNRFIVLTTSDGGQTWTHVLNEPTGVSAEAGWNNSWWWSDPQHGWFGTNQVRTWRTTNRGSTWTSAATSSANSIGITFGDPLHGVVTYDDGTISTSSDGGASWSNGVILGGGLVGAAFAPGTSTVWAAGQSTPFHSIDTGHTWTQETTYPFEGSIDHLSAADPTHAWSATSFGQILSYLPVVTSVPGEPPQRTPSGFTLYQNYPNPFNPSTVIEYTVAGTRDQGPGGRNVRLVIYDVLGREVAMLVNENELPGTYHVKFDATRLSTGVYFYRLTTGNVSSTLKMTLIK